MLLTTRAEIYTGLFNYTPSLAAAALFTVLFALTTTLHFYQLIRTKTWFMIAFCLGGLCEAVGYVGRILSAHEAPLYTLGPYVICVVLVLVAPTLFAASIYMELGRIVEMTEGDGYLIIRRKFITSIFVAGDIISFFMQGGGGGLMASKKISTRTTGEHVIVGGLFVQIISFGLFVLTALLFNLRLAKNPTERAMSMPWKKHMLAVYIVSILVFIRSVVRVVEFLQGFDGYIYSHEAFIYCFDALPMLAAMITINVIHPSEVQMLNRGGKAVAGFKMKEQATESYVSRV